MLTQQTSGLFASDARGRFVLLAATSGVALLASASIAAAAEAPAVSNRAAIGVEAVAAPPRGFDVTVASAAQLELYHVPPAPDAVNAPDAYARWKAAVSGAKSVGGTLQATKLYNMPNLSGPVAKSSATIKNLSSTTSSNWSGTAVYNSSNPFKVEAIETEFVVPTAHQAIGACTGGWDYSSQWDGIDGYGSGDVLQAGTEADAHCSGGTKSSYYSAWIEWYPYSETRVSSPAISPGDLMFVEVWNVSSTSGYAYLRDYTTNVTAEYHLSAPSGTTLVGNSVEWIVERPGISGGLATLTNYVDASFPLGYAWNYTSSTRVGYYEALTPATGTLYDIEMTDNNGAGISSPKLENVDFLFFEDFGSACGISSPPC